MVNFHHQTNNLLIFMVLLCSGNIPDVAAAVSVLAQRQCTGLLHRGIQVRVLGAEQDACTVKLLWKRARL